MLQKYFPALWALLLIPLGYHLSPLALLAIPLGLAALLSFSEEDHPWYLKIGLAGLVFLIIWATGGRFAPLQIIAWAIYIFGRPYWGPQRAFIAFPFLMISAEALPYYVPVGIMESIELSRSLQGWEIWHAWYYPAGKFGTSLQLLVAGLLLFLSYRNYKLKGQWSLPLVVLTLVIITVPLVFSFSDLNFSEASYIKAWHFRMAGLDSFLARLSFFLAFFLILFALVRLLLPKQNADDRFT